MELSADACGTLAQITSTLLVANVFIAHFEAMGKKRSETSSSRRSRMRKKKIRKIIDGTIKTIWVLVILAGGTSLMFFIFGVVEGSISGFISAFSMRATGALIGATIGGLIVSIMRTSRPNKSPTNNKTENQKT